MSHNSNHDVSDGEVGLKMGLAMGALITFMVVVGVAVSVLA